MELTERQERFLTFVKEQHGDQKRKYTGVPYWTHVYDVAGILAPYEPKGIEIAFGHDLLEDTECTYQQLHDFLSQNGYPAEEATFISDGVQELTDVFIREDYPDKNRKARKALEAARLGKISPLAQSVKYADLIHNMSSIVEEDAGFAVTFAREKRDILDQMRAGNVDLLIQCCYVLYNTQRLLKASKTTHP